ncbi:SPRTN protein, partial [Nyctibius grandis]|nr:SPRTN protein [Nyctibius grandis]
VALQLQALLEAEDKAAAVAAVASYEASPNPSALRPLSVVDEAWELLDPSPDVHGLFAQLNEMLFWGLLGPVQVSWSSRMTVSAGVCNYEGKSGMCSIRLSEPILKLRPRKDLVQTLLHEMIHALLFVTKNDKDRTSHGPEFCKHMHRINRLTGANVTIYHSFYDEVELYRQHWWQCNGPCQNREPYFGVVKRSMNRAPSARDFWWAEHQATCGGTFIKVKEPEKFSKKSKKKTQPAKLPNSESTNKGKTQMRDTPDLIPFSGNGYWLGGDSGPPEKCTNSSSSVRNRETPGSQHPSAGRTIPIPKNEIKLEKSPHSGIFFPFYTYPASEKINLASKREFPKPSVSGTNTYENVNGLPAKIPRVMEEKSNHGKRVMPSYSRPPIEIFFEQTTAAQGASEEKSSKLNDSLHQWPKMEDKSAFENYFFKKGNTDVTLSINTPSASSSTAVRQDKKVSCPVCQTVVLESKINEHLDFCL